MLSSSSRTHSTLSTPVTTVRLTYNPDNNDNNKVWSSTLDAQNSQQEKQPDSTSPLPRTNFSPHHTHTLHKSTPHILSKILPTYQSMLLPDEVIDITKSKKLLKPVSSSCSKENLKLSPRRRALARKSSNLNNSTKFNSTRNISESQGHNQLFPSLPISSDPKLNSSGSNCSGVQDGEEDENLQYSEMDSDVKNLLFSFPRAEILAFEELSDDQNSKGRLIGHGLLEIYQLHNKTVNYLHCGSVVHAILPRLKILKVSRNQFILSLSNPERYWRIILDTKEDSIIQDLELAFKQICFFRDVYFPATGTPDYGSTQLTSQPSSSLQQPPNLNEIPFIAKVKSSSSLSSINTAVACFAVDSDTTGTYVEEEEAQKGNHVDSPAMKRSSSVASLASTLDLALDEFFEDDSQQVHTAYPNLLLDGDRSQISEANLTLESSFLKNSSFQESSTPKFNRVVSGTSTPGGKSNRISIYETESSWMDPAEDLSMLSNYSTSSNSTIKRYIYRNLDAQVKYTAQSRSAALKFKTKEPLIGISRTKTSDNNKRLSSYDVFNLLTNDDNGLTEEEEKSANTSSGGASFTGFLRSFIG